MRKKNSGGGSVRMIFKPVISLLVLLMFLYPASAGSIVVTVSDFKPIVKAIAGEDFDVVSLLPPAANPHEFSLSVDDLKELRRAELIVLANSNFFDFEAKISKEFTNVLDFNDYNARLYDCAEFSSNPHGYWMLPENAVSIAKAVADRLSEMHPEKREQFEENYRIFRDRVENAVKEANEMVRGERGKYVALVPGVCYIARSLNLTIAAIVISEGAAENAQKLAEIREKLKNGEYKGIIAPEFMKYGKGGEMARELVKDTKAKLSWVKFSQGDTAYDIMLISNAASIVYSESCVNNNKSQMVYALAVFSVIEALIIALLVVRR